MIPALSKHRLFQSNRSWQGPNALVPVDICYTLLDLLAWTGLIAAIVFVVLPSFVNLLGASSFLASWATWALILPIACAAIFRGLPFSARFALFALSVLISLGIVAVQIGMSPNNGVVIVLLLTALSLFFGYKAGLAGLSLILALHFVAAWGWTHGLFPLVKSPPGSTGPYVDFRSPVAWFRVLAIMALLMFAMLMVVRFLLQRLGIALNEAKTSEHKFRTLFEAANDAIFLMDDRPGAERVFLSCNRRAEIIFGCKQEDIVGHSPFKFLPPYQPDGRDSTEMAREKAAAALAGRPQVFEWQHRRMDGTLFDAEVSMNRLDLGDRMLLQAIVRDVTPRKQAEAALQENMAFNEAILDSIHGLVFLYDEAGRLCRWNKQHEQLTGYSAAELNGMHVLKWCRGSEPDTSRAVAALRDVWEKGQAEIEINLITKDGRSIPYYVSGVRLMIAGKKYFTGIGLDLTALQRARTENQQLQAQLFQAQKMEAVGQLAGGIAHDFNNILTGILLQSNVLKEQPELSEVVRDGLKDLEAEAKRAANLTRQLLALSRRQTLKPKLMDLNALLANLLAMLRRLIGEQIVLEFSSAADALWLEADPGMLEQVVLNLVINARDAMPNGGKIVLTARIVEFDDAIGQRNPEASRGRFICLTISDTGGGMDEATIRRIFEPFFTTKEAGRGTGLGLAIAYSIVKQHRGWIEVQSVVGLGSTFNVFLPSTAQPTAGKNNEAYLVSVLGGHETVLLVEDEELVRRAIKSRLQPLGYRVLDADNGLNARMMWEQHQGAVDLLVADVVLPGGMSGLDLAKRLLEEKPQLKVILISGYNLEMAQQGLLQNRAIRFLPKPFEAATLTRLIRESLDG